MTPYTYECPDHGAFEQRFTMGEAPRNVFHGCGQMSLRVYDAALQFTYGKADFHGPTLGERIAEQRAAHEEAGIKAEPVGTRWV